MAPSDTNKKRSTKGKPLSESLREKDEKKAQEVAAFEADLAEEQAASRGDSSAAEASKAEASEGEQSDEGDESDEGEESDEGDESDETAERVEAPTDDEVPEEESEESVAASLGSQRYVAFAFLVLWLLVSFVVSHGVSAAWSKLAAWPAFIRKAPYFAALVEEGEVLSRSTVSMILGGIFGAMIVLHYYRRADIRQWASEVAEEISKVKWPTRKEVGSYTVTVIAGSALLTAYLTLLDRFWAFVTNFIYST